MPGTSSDEGCSIIVVSSEHGPDRSNGSRPLTSPAKAFLSRKVLEKYVDCSARSPATVHVCCLVFDVVAPGSDRSHENTHRHLPQYRYSGRKHRLAVHRIVGARDG